MAEKYRSLSENEIAKLLSGGSTAPDWQNVEVNQNFNPEYVVNVHFSGKITLGAFDKTFELSGGLRQHSGLYNCIIHNCVIGNNVYINKIHNYIANYTIGDGTFIENCDLLLTDTDSSFGNGVSVKVLNESGSHSIKIFDNLNAQLAYIFTLYRQPALTDRLTEKIDNYAESITKTIGEIGENVKIINSGTIKNTRIGDNADIFGAVSLENGSINSESDAPIFIANGVKMSNFIVSSNSRISDFALLENCFVGQGCKIGKQFSAIDSLFFANCEMFHGEAVSVFAAPHSVSHHKSTLLIAGIYSFFNAGSGANQSNHNYGLGAIHQGIFERGVKLGSSSYLLLPVKIGAFTIVAGKHKSHPDTLELPFSYLLENEGESYLLPARNFVNAGFERDCKKFLQRDNRASLNQLDFIVYEQLNPLTVKAIRNALDLLATLQEEEKKEIYTYKNCKITYKALRKGISYYAMAIDLFFGNELNRILSDVDLNNSDEIRKKLQADGIAGNGDWLDLAGLPVPKSEVEKLLNQIENDNLSLVQINAAIRQFADNYDKYKHNWLIENILDVFGKNLDEIGSDDIKMWLNLHNIQKQKYLELMLNDK
ncbi:MAG: DUF4954 family protein [Paludibacter sp.]|jgi:NDP-sugar pyrophosphorylase family protein|nr:DUF4954 family protein [Paludibacter sp.]